MKNFSFLLMLLLLVFVAQPTNAQVQIKVNPNNGQPTKVVSKTVKTPAKKTVAKTTATKALPKISATPKSTTTTTPAPSSSGTTTTSGGGFGGTKSGTSSTPTTPAPTTTPPASTSTSSKGGFGGSTSGSTTTTPGSTTGTTTNTGGGYSQSDAATAIKDALFKGIANGVNLVSVKDGYFGNALIKIPFPQEAQAVQQTLQMIGMGSLTDKLTEQLNRSAEEAAKEALPIFTNSITQLTISDAINIVSNQQSDAATQFLKRTTNEQLVSAFRPKIKGVLDKTMTTQLWSEVMGAYNKVPFVQPINPDLTDYVTRKALDGLFIMVAQEEAKIRKDPAAQTTNILKKVFGNLPKF
jgi:hypothetical protein